MLCVVLCVDMCDMCDVLCVCCAVCYVCCDCEVCNGRYRLKNKHLTTKLCGAAEVPEPKNSRTRDFREELVPLFRKMLLKFFFPSGSSFTAVTV